MFDALNQPFIIEEILSFHFEGHRSEELSILYEQLIETIPVELDRSEALRAPPFLMEGDLLSRLHMSLIAFDRNVSIYDIEFNMIF